VFADLIDGPLAHIPPGLLGANFAWIPCAAIARDLLRSASALAGNHHPRARGSTLRCKIVNVAARLTPNAGQSYTCLLIAPAEGLACAMAQHHRIEPITTCGNLTPPAERPNRSTQERSADQQLPHAYVRRSRSPEPGTSRTRTYFSVTAATRSEISALSRSYRQYLRHCDQSLMVQGAQPARAGPVEQTSRFGGFLPGLPVDHRGGLGQRRRRPWALQRSRPTGRCSRAADTARMAGQPYKANTCHVLASGERITGSCQLVITEPLVRPSFSTSFAPAFFATSARTTTVTRAPTSAAMNKPGPHHALPTGNGYRLRQIV
jgi:hypothetical protein